MKYPIHKYQKSFNRFVLIILLGISYTTANAQQAEEVKDMKVNFQHLVPGLKEASVRELIGSPTRVESFKLVANNNQDTTLFWFYGSNNWTLVFTNHYLDRIEISRDKLLYDIQKWANDDNKDGIRLIYGK
jgi:hypothetical protein